MDLARVLQNRSIHPNSIDFDICMPKRPRGSSEGEYQTSTEDYGHIHKVLYNVITAAYSG